MRMSLNCLLIGETSDKSFSVDIGKEIIVISGRNSTKIKFRDIKISHIKYLVLCQMSDENIKSDALVLWKVDGKMVENSENILKRFSSENDIKTYLGGERMEPRYLLSKYFIKKKFGENKISREAIHIIVQVLEAAATGQKRSADLESVDIEQKRLKAFSFKMVLEELEKNILVNKPQKLYPGSTENIAGRFSKGKIPISCSNYVDMRLDDENTTESGKYLLGKLRNDDESFYLLYAVSGAGKTRTIFDIAMDNNGIYVVYMECRPPDTTQLEPTRDRNFASLVSSVETAFAIYDVKNAIEETKNIIFVEIAARIFYLILLKKRFPDISSRDYLLSQINGGQEIISSIKDKLSHYRSKDLESIIKSALSHLKDKLIYQKSLVFAIDEANVASKKLFDGYFRNRNGNPRGLLTPIVEILNLFKISIIVAGTSFSLKQGSEIQSDIGKDNISEFLIDFKTTESKDVEAYVNRYLNLSECDIKKIENSKYLVGRPRLVARLVKEIIKTEDRLGDNKSKQFVLETAVNMTVMDFKNRMTERFKEIATDAYEKGDLKNVTLRKILMALFINCWFFDGYVSKSEIDDDSAIFVDCGIASLKSDDENKKFWMVKEPLAIEIVKTVLSSLYKQPTEALIKILLRELRQSAYYKDKSNTWSKGIVWQYLAIGRLIDFSNKTVSEFVNEIHGSQSNLPEWTKEAVIKFKSYGNLEMFSRLDKALKNDLDVIDSFLYESTFSEYMLIPGQIMRPDGVYIGKLDQTYWTLLISAKMFTENLSGKKIDEDKQSTDWKLMYYPKDSKSEIKCNELRKKFDDMYQSFIHRGSLRIHYILPGLAINNITKQPRKVCYVEGNDVIIYIDETSLERYFTRAYSDILKEISKP